VRWSIPSQRSGCIDDEHGGNARKIEKEREIEGDRGREGV